MSRRGGYIDKAPLIPDINIRNRSKSAQCPLDLELKVSQSEPANGGKKKLLLTPVTKHT